MRSSRWTFKKKVDGEEICTAEWGVVGRNTYGCQLYMVDESHSFSGWHSQDSLVHDYLSDRDIREFAIDRG